MATREGGDSVRAQVIAPYAEYLLGPPTSASISQAQAGSRLTMLAAVTWAAIYPLCASVPHLYNEGDDNTYHQIALRKDDLSSLQKRETEAQRD
jgi:hypothetical protein